MGLDLNPEPVLVDPSVLTGGAPIVVLAPHPDDESLGCGALLAHAFAHAGAHVVCMTDGSASHPGSRAWPPARLARARRDELAEALISLGGSAADMTWLGHPDGWLGAEDEIRVADAVAAICARLGAGALFAPAPEDHHEDHKAAARIARRVAEWASGTRLYSYPVWSRWDDPDHAASIAGRAPVHVSTASVRDAKRAAIGAHATQGGGVVTDDPTGFVLPAAFIERFVNEPEVFWREPWA